MNPSPPPITQDSAPVPVVDAVDFRDGMRKLASGIALVTTSGDTGPAGLAVTAVSSVSFEPPSLLICVNRTASAHDAILATGGFVVNVLAGEHIGILESFSQSARRHERFAHPDWTTADSGMPVLRSALAAFECRITERVGYGTHSIIIGDVVAARSDDGTADPLIYLDRHTRSLAEHSA
ncbi:flavin reductase family protein [Microbacterium trichothecenolyticum]|uniref:Flavin reductase n=1 Tax=Microbacterium trichothecenolyticum TaxID=69370 RepID=A0ABU0TYA6_MICTR|nr:flavin reductase family protein [Microbacterium trichothecenolyticum]MDQ1124636.1 flavin reductase [Microbacterium trichothecenolyticum]